MSTIPEILCNFMPNFLGAFPIKQVKLCNRLVGTKIDPETQRKFMIHHLTTFCKKIIFLQ